MSATTRSGTILFALVLLAAPAASQTYDEVRDEMKSFTDARESLDQADHHLRNWLKDHGEAVDLDLGQIELVDELLTAWRTYTELECALVGRTTGGSTAFKTVYDMICQERRFGAREKVIVAATNRLERVLRQEEDKAKRAEGDKNADQDDEELYASDCLPPLTPLKNETDYQA